MHDPIRAKLENYLENPASAAGDFEAHLQSCAKCSGEVANLSGQSRLVRSLRGPEFEPAAGFYARVRERIEAQARPSVFAMLLDTAFGRPLALASAAMVLLMAGYIATTEPGLMAPPQPRALLVSAQDDPPSTAPSAMAQPDQDRNTVLVNLVSFRD